MYKDYFFAVFFMSKQEFFRLLRVLAPVLLLASLPGCIRPGAITPPAATWEDHAALQKIRAQGEGIKGLLLRGHVRITLRGKAGPRIRFVLNWREDQGRQCLRVHGMGPLGMTAFDLLIDEHALWLYIPKYNRVFWQPMIHDPSLNGHGIPASAINPAFLLQEASLALNPWSIVLEQNTLPCRPESTGAHNSPYITIRCQKGRHETAEASFRKDFTVIPDNVTTGDMNIIYHAPAILRGLRNAYYPSSMTIDLTQIPLRLDVQLREITANRVVENPETFNSAPFTALPISPLDELVNALSGRKAGNNLSGPPAGGRKR